MDDPDSGFGIVYHFENVHQLLSELEEIVHLPYDPTLTNLDSTLKRFIDLCASHHEQFLQTSMQLDDACDILIKSDLFVYHSERMYNNIVQEVRKINEANKANNVNEVTDTQLLFIYYNVLLFHERKQEGFLRTHKRLQPLIPLLIENILVDSSPGTQDVNPCADPSTIDCSWGSIVPTKTKIRTLSIQLLYEVCRVQKLSYVDLKYFNDSYIDHLFDLVEQTRAMEDETFNYSVIKLIVALNEQFMVALLPLNVEKVPVDERLQFENRVISVLMRRLGSSKTFGENLIFMLNRANRTPEDLCMQLLVLKLLYILFTTQGTSEYFYSNDLCVLVDVFLREVVDLDEDSESLRHTYLRVLHPLLTRTQLRSTLYKRPQIKVALESLVSNAKIRDVNPTTKRLVERCLGGDWCVQLPRTTSVPSTPVSESMPEDHRGPASKQDSNQGNGKSKHLKPARSVENLRPPIDNRRGNAFRKASTDSSNSLPSVAVASSNSSRHDRPHTTPPTQDRPLHPRSDPVGVYDVTPPGTIRSEPDPDPPSSPPRVIPSPSGRRSAPPVPPVKRRKPPAVPVHKLNGVRGGRKSVLTIGQTITSSPLHQK